MDIQLAGFWRRLRLPAKAWKDGNPIIRLLKDRDFPLLEIVMSFIAVSLFLMLYCGGVFSSGEPDGAGLNARRMVRVKMALETYKWANNSFPAALGALACEGAAARTCVPFATPDLLRDPWGGPFLYRASGSGFVIKSLGADGLEGGAGEAADSILKMH
ncbi:MAG: type II secretion system protein GspG [Elusimicrobiota bacterium]|nr:type II secretion system protein GspG [Elusimicrobiota bacterium]